jgi:peptidoglycan/xylan/chitin deacetylase (PgdA/CDA1 family)
VRYGGSAILPATDGWLDAADVGPIPPPPADWAQPTFPPRQVVRGLRSEIVRGDPSIPLIALTFDAGADIGDTLVLLQALRALEVRATFFITGQFADRYPDVVRMIAEDGHELANHSYSHPDFAKLSEPAMRSEIQRATASIESAAGVKVAALWRPPFGSRTNRILQIVEEEGFLPIYWTFDSGDWLPNATTEKVLDTDLRLAANGAIVVHHVQPRATALAIPTVIQELRDRGFDFVTVSDLLGPTAVSR